MAKRAAKSSTNVQELLDERHAVTKWLDRLAKAKDAAGDDIQAKVRADYETRLEAVNEQLQGYTKELAESLSRQREREEELSAREITTDERLSEAKLRHAVGEYDDAKWNAASSEIEGELSEIREELKAVNGEIARLDDVLHSIDDAAPSESKKPVAAAKSSKAKGKDKATRESFDELEFLKKVASDDPPARRSGAQFTPKELPDTDALITESAIRRETPAQLESDADETESKTLKCDECATLNRPTEWYCESCGAELAAL